MSGEPLGDERRSSADGFDAQDRVGEERRRAVVHAVVDDLDDTLGVKGGRHAAEVASIDEDNRFTWPWIRAERRYTQPSGHEERLGVRLASHEAARTAANSAEELGERERACQTVEVGVLAGDGDVLEH